MKSTKSLADSNDGSIDSSAEFLVNREWRLVKRIGAGSFGEIFLAVHRKTNEQAAVKLEVYKSGVPVQLQTEFHLLRALHNNPGITKIYWFGRDGVQNLYTALVMEYLGPSLEDLHIYCECKFSLKTVAMLADQMLKRIEILHRNFLIHRDIKPDNFVMGVGQNFNTVYIIDFGLSKYYMDPKTKEHCSFRDFRNLTGTARYCSINAHAGYEQSRRDDLESLGYVFLYFIRGSLPWQGLQADSKREKFRKIYKTKLSTRTETLCQGLPEEFAKYLNYCRNLAFEEEPKYKYLRSLFWRIMEKKSYKYDCQFDWNENLGNAND
ncbi:casein kinase 1, alpha [Paragonimus westermani]|uniref:non-specific serine/threonine protein kinase n=1 Tax=Paragonimus westermani TaxID=34504 RepID=A0A5J4NAN4_9TREM|nr:casein kinase 1, alpha [Paragonimus westermani]